MRSKGIVAFALLTMTCGTARSGNLSKAQGALEADDCQQALLSATRAENLATPSREQDVEIAFIRAQRFERDGRTADAMGRCPYIAKASPDSSYGFRARASLQADRAGPHSHEPPPGRRT